MGGLRTTVAATLVVAVLAGAAAAAALAQRVAGPGSDQATPIARGPHVSGAVRYRPSPFASATAATAVSCSTPGATNYIVDCDSHGRPVNEVSIATNQKLSWPLLLAGANDYNSYNGQGQDGYFWSSGGKTWSSAGPIDVFPHNPSNAAGDPALALGSDRTVYYGSIFFNFNDCSVGGVELLRQDPVTKAWSYYQIAPNSQQAFEDKPALAIDSFDVYLSWTQFASCSGSGVASPIKVAILPLGGSSQPPRTILSVPGSTYSQGSSIATDGSGGFWIAWEEYPSASASVGAIKLAHWSSAGGWSTPQTISPSTFVDLPSPMPGFSFRTNSFPSVAAGASRPDVVWASADSGIGRVYLWSSAGVAAVAPAAGSQFFPAVAGDGSSGLYVTYSQVNGGQGSYDAYLAHVTATGTTVSRVSTASSYPNNDAFFSGSFIGDYSGIAVYGGVPYPAWTDIRGPDPSYSGYEMNGVVYAG